MKSYVAVQKRLLMILYTLWKKNEAFQIKSIAVVDAEPTSRVTANELINENRPEQVGAKQGRHSHFVSASTASRVEQK